MGAEPGGGTGGGVGRRGTLDRQAAGETIATCGGPPCSSMCADLFVSRDDYRVDPSSGVPDEKVGSLPVAIAYAVRRDIARGNPMCRWGSPNDALTFVMVIR